MSNFCVADMHIHSEHSPDSRAKMADICEAAVKAGLKYIAFTDHVEIHAFVSDGYDGTIAASYEEAGRLKALYKDRLHIARGVEMGQPMHDVKTAETLLDSYDFDFVLGSLHNLKDDMDFYYYDYSKVDINPLLERFFKETLDMVKWGRFDSLAHLTYPFRYIKKAGFEVEYEPWADIIDDIFREMAQREIALEINVSGFRHFLNEPLPGQSLIGRFYELGGRRVTIGTDTHKAPDVGRHIGEGAMAAKKAGFEYITVYQDKRAIMIPIG